MKLAILDRDGTFIWEPEKPKGVDPRETFPLKNSDEVAFLPGAIEGMQLLRDRGYTLVMATNQTFLGTVKHPQHVFDAVMNSIVATLNENGLVFDFVMVCPHGPDEGCECRKPATGGMAYYMQGKNIDFKNSLMFGDRDTDGEFARNLGIRFVRIPTNGTFTVPDDVQ